MTVSGLHDPNLYLQDSLEPAHKRISLDGDQKHWFFPTFAAKFSSLNLFIACNCTTL